MALQAALLFSGDWIASSYYAPDFRSDLDVLVGAGGIGTWTLEPINTENAATTLEYEWFVMRHNVTDCQLLFSVNNGTASRPSFVFDGAAQPSNTLVGTGTYTSTDRGFWMSQDALGGGVGSGSFLDVGYTQGFTPSDNEFWTSGSLDKTSMIGFTWINDDPVSGVANPFLVDLYLVYDDDPNVDTLLFMSRRSQRATQWVFAMMGSQTLDESKTVAGDRIAHPGMVFIGFAGSSTGPDFLSESSILGVDTPAEGGKFEAVVNFDTYSMYTSMIDQTALIEPQDSLFTTAKVPIFRTSTTGRIIGNIDDDWIKFIPPVTGTYRQKRIRPSDSREYVHLIRELITAWPGSLAVPP
jgi:hypothetical protein